jgi:hypothetical protein
MMSIMECYLETTSLLEREADHRLAHRSVLHIKAFLDGFACSDVWGRDADRLSPLINGFSAFLSEKHGGREGNYWFELLKQGYDDADSFELYFKEWRDFCRGWQQPSSIAVTISEKAGEVFDVTNTLNHIKSRPGMYFFCPSIGVLFSYLKGVQRACECYPTGARIEPDMQRFEAWLSEKCELKNPCRWDRLLLVENGFDERVAFQRFFERLDEFRKSGGPSDAVLRQGV